MPELTERCQAFEEKKLPKRSKFSSWNLSSSFYKGIHEVTTLAVQFWSKTDFCTLSNISRFLMLMESGYAGYSEMMIMLTWPFLVLNPPWLHNEIEIHKDHTRGWLNLIITLVGLKPPWIDYQNISSLTFYVWGKNSCASSVREPVIYVLAEFVR